MIQDLSLICESARLRFLANNRVNVELLVFNPFRQQMHKFQLTEALSKTREKEALNKTRDQDVALQTENHRGCELSHEPRSTTSRTRSTALFAAASSSAILFQLLSVSRAVLSVSWPSAL
jgi:hypothetical protein